VTAFGANVDVFFFVVGSVDGAEGVEDGEKAYEE